MNVIEMPYSLSREMEDFEEEMSVVDVYDIVTDFAKELRPILDIYGPDPLRNVMSRVVGILEHLEAQAMKIRKLNTALQEKDGIIEKLEKDKIDKAADRQRFEKELEQIEEHWREESREMVAMINRLQEENKKLNKSLAIKDSSAESQSQPLSPEVDITVLQRSRASIEKLRDQLKAKEKEIYSKDVEIENLTDQVNKFQLLSKDLRKKYRLTQGQVRNLIDERADYIAQIQDLQHELSGLKQRLGIAQKENEDLVQSHRDRQQDLTRKAVYDLDDPNRPRFTTDELKEILKERNEFKARVSDLEEELSKYRPKPDDSPVEEDDEEEEDAPVQGPIPFEPSDAPWRRSESGIRKLFRKLFSETNVTFFGSSPKRSLSSLSKMALASGTTLDSPL